MDIAINYYSPAVFAMIISIFLAVFVLFRDYRYYMNALCGVLDILASCWFFHLYLLNIEPKAIYTIYILALSSAIAYFVFLLFHRLDTVKSRLRRIFPENSIVLPRWMKFILGTELTLIVFSLVIYSFFTLSESYVFTLESTLIILPFLILLETSFLGLLSAYRLIKNANTLGSKMAEKAFSAFLAVFWGYFSLGSLVVASKTLGVWLNTPDSAVSSEVLPAVAHYLVDNNLVSLLIASTLGVVVILALLVTRYYFFGFKVFITQFIASLIVIFNLVSILNSGSVEEIVLRSILIIILAFLSHFLVKSVTGEIEKRKQIQDMAQKIYEANKNLHKLDKAKSEFIASASHQLRSPLSVIKGIGSMLLDGSYGKLSAPIKDALEKVYISNERLIGLIEDLLDVSHLEEGKVDFNFEKINLNDMAQKAVDGLSLQAQNKKLYLKFSPWKKSKLLPWTDEQKVTEAISNLIDNAIKYTRRGGIKVEVRKNGDKARVTVKDTGIGLKKDEIGHLFQKFVRAGRGNKMSTVGTGLGLYVVRKMIEAHKGKIWAESAGEGRGSSFIIELPLTLKNPPDKKFIQRTVMEKQPA